MTPYEEALKFTLGMEGGEVDDPADTGGHTNYGVTQARYDVFRKRNGLPPQSVSHITKSEIRVLYQTEWAEGHCDELLLPTSTLQFDAAVHHGAKRAIKILQQAVNAAGITIEVLKVDGLWGPKTSDAAASHDIDLENALLWKRLTFMRNHVQQVPTKKKFFLGWVNRILKLKELI